MSVQRHTKTMAIAALSLRYRCVFMPLPFINLLCPRRKVHLRLKAEALRGIQAVPFSQGHHYALVTDSEHRAFIDQRPMSDSGAIVMPLLYNLLGRNFHENVVAGYGQVR